MISQMEIASQMLNVPISKEWYLQSDQGSSLCSAHYVPSGKTGKAPNGYEKIRGVVMDLDKRLVLADSYGYTPTIVADQIDHSVTSYIDTDGNPVNIDFSKCSFRAGFEGTLVRVFKYNGKVFKASHRNMDIQRGRWADSETFGTLFEKYSGGDLDQTLFDPSKDYSPFCHYFLICDPSLLLCSRIPMQSGFLVYLGHRQLWDPSTSGISMESIDTELHLPPVSTDMSGVYNPPMLTSEQATHHLRYGFGPQITTYDVRLYDGEFVIAYDETSNVAVKVYSTSYHWRSLVRSTNMSLWGRLYDLYQMAHTTLDRWMFPTMMHISADNLRELVAQGDYHWEQPVENDERDFYSRWHTVWQTLLYVVPACRKNQVLDLVSQVQNEIQSLTQYVCDVYRSKGYLKEEMSPVIKTVISRAMTKASEDLKTGANVDRSGKKHGYHGQVLFNISKTMRYQASKFLKAMTKYAMQFTPDGSSR